jgi:hypothetical protein
MRQIVAIVIVFEFARKFQTYKPESNCAEIGTVRLNERAATAVTSSALHPEDYRQCPFHLSRNPPGLFFWSCTGPTAQPAETKQAEIRPIKTEEFRENQLSDRLTGPEATHELIDYIRSLKTASGGGSILLLSGGGGAFAIQIAEYLRNDVEVSSGTSGTRGSELVPVVGTKIPRR